MPAFSFQGKTYNNPVELALGKIGGKWKMPILWRLHAQVWRYGALKKDLGNITHKMLTEQLRELEWDGLVTREVFQVVPPHVEYSLTNLGQSAFVVIESLRDWGKHYAKHAPAPSVDMFSKGRIEPGRIIHTQALPKKLATKK